MNNESYQNFNANMIVWDDTKLQFVPVVIEVHLKEMKKLIYI